MPVGRDAHRWNTFQGERKLVVAARTVTSTVRILETLPSLLRDDGRVTVVFAYDPTSAFNAGVLDLLRAAECSVMPWEQLGDIAPDLILSASENIDVPEGVCPVLVLPHGIGFQKFVPDSRSSEERLSGVVTDALLESGRAWLAVSHPAQEEQLLATHPKTAGRTLLVGDPCFDELVASLEDRSAYREALGVAEHQRLVMVSSTWRDTSLLGRHPDLLPRLLAQLPCDEYRVGAIAHPNVWSAHGGWQIRNLQAAALDAGLLLMPPVHAWRPALVAADVLVGDHGSVTLYGASIGTPLLLAAFGGDAVPGTAAHDLSSVAPRLDLRRGLRQQVDNAVREHTPDRYAAVTRQAFADPGHALADLRTAVYKLLKLPEPLSPRPVSLVLPVPEPPASAVTSWHVTTGVSGDSTTLTVTVHRFPATVGAYGEVPPDSPSVFSHLACADDEPDRRLSESASVLARSQPAATSVGALSWIESALARLPGSLLAASAVRGGCTLVGLRDGRVVEAAITGPVLDPGLPAAVVYACLRAGHPLEDAQVTLRIGDTRGEDVILRVRPAPVTG
ncbi:hypothetical protein [Streptomyces justiciae]|uniref:hypothetical protein n=1 Tax=Streptomyces justiciae TaxID=2780140 RepID=UPI002117CC6C|nr:hypothetical protein [Streptomyces justiciae]MCW8379755.1 hypothetical protein [Streptomyces justiciae]